MSRSLLLGFAGLLLVSGSASAQHIGIFMDANATSCAAEVGPNPRIDLHVIAILGGSVPVMTGAQFMIEGAPETWKPRDVLWVPDVNVVINVGHPIFPNPVHPNSPGVNIAFGSCQGSTRVPLGRIVLLGPPTSDNVRLRVTWFELGGADPNCPFVTNCDAPAFPMVCVSGGEIVLNGPPPSNCQTAVEERTWTTVKRLYG
jgi:hypothetical protein